jgi:hypothetical protein
MSRPVTKVTQCNSSINGGGGTLRCSVRVVNSAQLSFAVACGSGFYAPDFPALGTFHRREEWIHLFRWAPNGSACFRPGDGLDLLARGLLFRHVPHLPLAERPMLARHAIHAPNEAV